MNTLKKWGYVLPVAMLVLWSVNTLAEVGVTDDTIKIGVVSDLTGPTAIGGVGMADGIVSFFKDLNEKREFMEERWRLSSRIVPTARPKPWPLIVRRARRMEVSYEWLSTGQRERSCPESSILLLNFSG